MSKDDVWIRPVPREEPDLRRLARALIELAVADAEATQDAAAAPGAEGEEAA